MKVGRCLSLLLLTGTMLAQVPQNFMTSLKFPTGRNMTNFQNWWNAKMRFFVDSPSVDIGAPPAGSYWTDYTDSTVTYVYQQWYADLAADTYGPFNPEGAFLHVLAADYAPISNQLMYAGDDFDIYEVCAVGCYQRPSQALNGVMNCTSGGTCTDVTVKAYCPDAPDTIDTVCANFTAAPFQITDHLLVGKTIPFYQINITITSPQVGGSVTYKYWNGSSYVALGAGQSLTDTTNGLTQTGTISWVLPQGFTWIRNVDQGARSKFHILIQPSGVTTNATIGRVYGDNMTTGGKNRGYVCTGTPNNQGTELEYCPTPTAGSTALIPSEARLVTGCGIGCGMGNYLDYQSGKSSLAYTKMVQAEHQIHYPAHQNGMFWDDIASNFTGVDYTKTEYGSTSVLQAGSVFYPRLYSLVKSIHPTWWLINNANHFSLQFPVGLQSSDSSFCEVTLTGTFETTIDSDAALAVCSNRLWCSGSLYNIGTSITDSYTGYPDVTWQVGQYSGKTSLMNFAERIQLYAFADGSGSTLPSQWHRTNQDKSAMGSLAAFYTIKNPNTFFSYHADSYWSLAIVGLDEYYFWVPSTATLGVALSPQVCTTAAPCTVTLAGQLVTTTTPLPGAIDVVSTITTSQGPIRIGGPDGDVVDWVATSPYNYPTTVNPSLPIKANAITMSHSVGESIEYMSRGFQADAAGVYQHPIGQWGMHIPASDINLGVPDPTNGFGAPCRNDAHMKPGVATNPGYPNYPNNHGLVDCEMDNGTLYSPNYPTLCDATGTTSTKGFCAQIVRRDFTGGQYGNAIVLWRPANISIDHTISTAGVEYDALSNPIPLGGSYYPLNTDGTIGTTSVTTVQLKAREGFIGVTQPGGVPNISSGVTLSGGGVIR